MKKLIFDQVFRAGFTTRAIQLTCPRNGTLYPIKGAELNPGGFSTGIFFGERLMPKKPERLLSPAFSQR
jgi:hypothetical protein